MSVAFELLHVLEDMTNDEFKTFKWFLGMSVLDGYKPIPKSHLEDASRTDTVSQIIQNFMEVNAVKATVTVLRKQCMNDLAERLLKACPEQSSDASVVTPAAPASSAGATSGVTPAAAGPSLTATDGSVIFAPIINNSNPGIWNVTLAKQ